MKTLLVIIVICFAIIQRNIALLDKEIAPSAIVVYPHYITAYITGYNSVEEQTDDSPCLAGGEYICGRTDVVACPVKYPKGTIVEIEQKRYECLDRMNIRYENKDLPYFDIYFGMDVQRAKEWGIKKLKVKIIDD